MGMVMQPDTKANVYYFPTVVSPEVFYSCYNTAIASD